MANRGNLKFNGPLPRGDNQLGPRLIGNWQSPIGNRVVPWR